MPATEYIDLKLLAASVENTKAEKLRFDFKEVLGKEKFFDILRESVTTKETKDFWSELEGEKQ